MTTNKEIPLEGIKYEVQEVIRHFAASVQAPTNYVATALLTAVGAVAGKRLIVEDGAYTNYGQLYTCLVGAPGAAKSPAMRVVMEPVNEIDRQYYADYRAALKAWKKDQNSDKPILAKIACDDVTTEKLLSILYENENGVILHADELTDFLGNLNRYNNGDNTPKYTKIWSGDAVRVDRKGDESLRIDDPFLSILSATQPVNLPRVFAKHAGTGFISRWLFCLPDAAPETRIEPNRIFYDYWANMVARLRKMPEIRLAFDEDAKYMLNEFDQRIKEETAYNVERKQNEIADYMIKQCYNIRRLAGIVHLMSQTNSIMGGEVAEYINVQEVATAEMMIDFYTECAKEVIATIEAGHGGFNVSSAALIKMIFEKFEVSNISELARAIGKSQQYVSKIYISNAGSNAIDNAENNAMFEEVWTAYNRKGSKKKSLVQWQKLSDEDKKMVLPHVRAYVGSRDRTYQKDFERYLRDKVFKDAVVSHNETIYDPEQFADSDEYRPMTDGVFLVWSENRKCVLFNGYIEQLNDGYTSDNRPDGARAASGMYEWVWSRKKKEWVKQ